MGWLRTPAFAVLLVLVGWCPGLGAAPVRIAAIFSRTGIAAEHNAPLIPMVELAVGEINARGGLLGAPLALTVLDNQSTSIGSVLAAEEAVRLGAIAVIGAHWSSHSLAMAEVLQKAGIPMISPGSTNPAVTRVGDFIFRACFLDSFQGETMARFARTDLGARTAAVVKNVDEAYSLTLAEFFSRSFAQAGGRVVLDEEYRGKAVDFSELVERIAKARPDVLYIPGYTRDSGFLIKQAAASGVRATFLGGDAWDEIYEYAGDATEGSYQSAPWHPEVPFPASAHLKEAYRHRFGTEVRNVSAPLAYDATMLLADAVRRAGSLDRRKIRDALAATTGFQGATGAITLDGNGDPRGKEVIILRWHGGRPAYFKAIQPP